MSNELESKNIAADLCKLALLLNTHNLCSDVSPLDNAGQSFIQKESASWDYELQKITFKNVDEVGGRVPSDSEEISVSLTITIKSTLTPSDKVFNPLSELSFDIELNGQRINPTTSNIDDLYACWHLDLHIEKTGDGTPKYCHPMYHFAFGGNKLEAMGDDFFGNGLVLPAPRLMYPPMDAVLGIDFILQNYFEREKIQTLLDDTSYIEIVNNSQTRLWKPFFASLYSFWDAASIITDDNFTNKKLFPFYS